MEVIKVFFQTGLENTRLSSLFIFSVWGLDLWVWVWFCLVFFFQISSVIFF